MNTEGTPGNVPLSEGLGLEPERAGQARLMTIAASEIGRDVEISEAEVGHWYSPAAVREMLAAERERCAKLWNAECERIVALLDGIDRSELDSPPGWWPNCDGAAYGESLLAQIRGPNVGANRPLGLHGD